jgi:mono/diheme cytochrome c family protein
MIAKFIFKRSSRSKDAHEMPRLAATALPLIALAALLASRPAHAAGEGDVNVARGQSIATEKCARCHAIGLEGPSPHEKAPPFRTLATRYPVENLAEALAEGIVTGHPDMPAFVFQPHEIEAFLAYLASVRSPE